MSNPEKFDLAIIGAGSAGLSIAAAAAQFGEKIVLFEKNEMGGDCLNTGCIPSKALLAAAKAAQAHRSSSQFGIAAHDPNIDYAMAMQHVAKTIARIAPFDSQDRFEKLGVKVVRQPARFISPKTVKAGAEIYTARRFVIATGSRAAVPAINGLAEVPFLTNETLFQNRVLPEHLIILGAGPIGLEMALAHRRLGSAVTVIEPFRALAKDDPELAEVVLQILASEGIELRINQKPSHVEKTKTGITVVLENGDRITGTHLLVAAGRVPNIEGLDLAAGGISANAKGINVDQGLRSTSNSRVYAAGDVAGDLQFTHMANYHAGLIIRNALFRLPVKRHSTAVPWVTYTDPELAQVGLQESDARKTHGDGIRVLRWSFEENDRAVAEGKPKGLVKIVATRRGKILGCGVVGPNAGDVIAMWALAIGKGLKVSDIANLVLPYPTYGEAGKRAAITFYAGLAENTMLRKFIGFLKKFG